MNIDIVFTNKEIESIQIGEKVVIAIDVLRATSSMVTSLNNKDNTVISVSDIEKAIILKKDDPHSQLCGERNGRKITGFDKGNSPLEYENISYTNLIFSSTNGSLTIEKCKVAKELYLGSFLNAKYLAQYIINNHSQDHLLFACSGKLGKYCIEDTLCAGYIIDEILNYSQDNNNQIKLSDGAIISQSFYSNNQDNICEIIRISEHGKYLESIGYGKDIAYCCQKDIYPIVPYYNKEMSMIIKLVKF